MCIRDYFTEQYKHTRQGRKWQRIHIVYTLLFIACIIVIVSTTLVVFKWKGETPPALKPVNETTAYTFYEDIWADELGVKIGDRYWGETLFLKPTDKATVTRVVSYFIYMIVILVAGFIVLEFKKQGREDEYVDREMDKFTSLFGCTVCF